MTLQSFAMSSNGSKEKSTVLIFDALPTLMMYLGGALASFLLLVSLFHCPK